MVGADLTSEVTTPVPYVVPAIGTRRYVVAAIDLGIKAMTPRRLAERGIEVHVLPATSTIDDVARGQPRRRLLQQRPRRPGHRRRAGAP